MCRHEMMTVPGKSLRAVEWHSTALKKGVFHGTHGSLARSIAA